MNFECTIEIDGSYTWSTYYNEEVSVGFSGNFWYENKFYSHLEAQLFLVKKIQEFLRNKTDCLKALEIFLNEIKGHYSFIFKIGDWVGGAVDRIRSYPVYYQEGSSFIISNNIYKIENEISSNPNHQAILEFKMSGYCIGDKTLHSKINQLLPGECLLFNCSDGNIFKKRYYVYGSSSVENRTEDEYHNLYDSVIEQTFRRLINSLDGAPVYIPLSAGLDSRLILAMLKEYGYKPIYTYTYGINGLWEVEQAKKFASYLGVPWKFIELNPNESRRLFHTEERKKYFQYAGGWNTTPQIPEYYGVMELKKRFGVEENAIFINGQAGDFLTGGHIPDFFKNLKIPTVRELLDNIINKHFALWTNLKEDENILQIKSIILEQVAFDKVVTEGKVEDIIRLYECFEWQERQSKYVANGQRAYEWFGYDWRLPLWQKELIDFWSIMPWEKKINQNFHKQYLKRRNYGNIFDIEYPERYSTYPKGIKVFRKIMGGLNLAWPSDLKPIINKYSKYYMTHAPFYTQLSYKDYLKNAEWHRNPVSYWSKEYLKENNVEK